MQCNPLSTSLCILLLFLHHPTVQCAVCSFHRLTQQPPAALRADAEAAETGRRNGKWVYNDQAASWKQPGTVYDRDVNALIEKYDHTCPFTGTAIGGGNIDEFHVFIMCVQVTARTAPVLLDSSYITRFHLMLLSARTSRVPRHSGHGVLLAVRVHLRDLLGV